MKIPFEEMLPWGICDFSDVSGALINCRAKSRLPQKAESIIVYLFPYYLGEEFYKNANLSKYAVPADYHEIAGEYLKKAAEQLKKAYPDFSFEWFCDNSPVPEVKAASLSGLGVVGQNGLLINEKYGSFVFIGEIVTDMRLSPSLKNEGRCLECGACRKACFGGALREENFNKDGCLSHLTQKKGELSPVTEDYIGKSGIIWGCDICQNVCPMNKNISVTPVKEFIETAIPRYKEGDSISGRAFSWRGESVINRNLKIMCCKDGKNNL